MSDLYQSPVEARRALDERTKKGGFNWGADWLTDRIREGVVYNDRTGDYKKEGAAFWLQPFGTSEGYKAIEQGKDKIRESEKIESVLESAPGVTDAQIREQLDGGKLTGKNARGVIAEAVRTRAEKPTPLQQSQINRGIKADERAATAQEQANDLAQKQLAATLAQGNRTHSLALLQLADNKDARAIELEYQKLRDRKADMQYNERMEQLDRKDRRMMMQSLAAGLASLGASFAL